MPDQPIVQFDNVSVQFDSLVALRDCSFTMRAGETRVILGAAGAGKTVLLKTTLGLYRPSAGRLLVFGEDVTRLPEKEWYDIRSKMGVLFQEGGLFDSLTIEENVSYPLINQRVARLDPHRDAAVIEERVRESLRFVELEHTLGKFPSELSGGMRRRVGIARAVVTSPPLELYDSPTAGLDPITANNIVSLIVKERDSRNTATMMVTHRYQDGQLMANFRYNPGKGRLEKASENGSGAPPIRTVFMVLNDGRVVFEGSQAELESSQDSYLKKFVRQE
ncbi:MAG: ATP-binding cassette domain-containing protein [Bryobacteraceae bacterium]|nr:ATP-binding cassette domain-containing protein [Bryobacteraceae bacterium]